jgi:predicted permease
MMLTFEVVRKLYSMLHAVSMTLHAKQKVQITLRSRIYIRKGWKTEGRKSRDTVPLIRPLYTVYSKIIFKTADVFLNKISLKGTIWATDQAVSKAC